MAAKNVILALLALTSFAYGQTRALFVTTNGTVQWGTTLRFDGPLDFTTNGFAATTRSNLSLGLPALTNTSNAGLMSALGGLTTNGNASGLTNFPAFLLTTNSSASAFPAALLRTNGDGSGLTNLPNANLSNATGVLPLANGGTGQTNAALAIQALLPAYTNNQGKVLGLDTNLALIWTTNAGGGGSGSVTNVDASGGSTGLTFTGGPITNGGTLTLGGTLNLASGGTGATNASGARTALQLGTAATNDATAFQPASTNLDTLANNNGGALTNVSVDLTTVLPAYSNNAAKVLAVASGETNVEWIAVSNTVTDASTLTNFPASILQTNSADGSFPAFLLRTNGSAAGLTSFPTLNQNTTGTASNVTGVVSIANGGSGQTTAAAALEAFLPSYSGNANRILALNSNATAVIWTNDNTGGGGGSVDLSTTNATGILPVVKGGTGATNGAAALTNLGIVSANNGVRIGTANSVTYGVIIGDGATNTYKGVAVGSGAKGIGNFNGGVGVGENASATDGGAAIGKDASSAQGGAVGLSAIAGIGGAIGQDAQAGSGGAIGRLAKSINGKGFAGGQSSEAVDGFAGGLDAKATATSSSQIGAGTNTNNNTLQFMSAGSVDTNEWARIAALSTYPTTNISVTGTNNTNTLVFSNGILVEVQ